MKTHVDRELLLAALQTSRATTSQLTALLGGGAPEEAVSCPKCGGTEFDEAGTFDEDDDEALFCQQCGEQLPQEKTDG